MNGLRRGRGILEETNGRVYEGEWTMSMRDGYGIGEIVRCFYIFVSFINEKSCSYV